MSAQMKTALALILLMVVGLFLAALEMMIDAGRKRLAATTASIAFLMLLGLGWAYARDDGRYAQSPLKGWFDSLKSGKGPCCSDADGTAPIRCRLGIEGWPLPRSHRGSMVGRAGRSSADAAEPCGANHGVADPVSR